MRTVSLIALFSLIAANAWAQAPSTDIYLLPMERGDDGSIAFGQPRNASNAPGYDNQPAFLPGDEAFLFTSGRFGEQTEVLRYDIATDTVGRVTDTPESEYSPTPLASGAFSTVRVETDSLGTQRLWQIEPDGSAAPVLEDVTGIGYHAWANPHEMILFVLGEPHELHRADRRTGRSTRLLGDIGRALHKIPHQNAMSFTQPLDESRWILRRLDLADNSITDLAPAVGESQDLTWTPITAEIWMTQESKVLRWVAGAWEELIDLAEVGITGLTRLVVSGDERWLAVVAQEAVTEAP